MSLNQSSWQPNSTLLQVCCICKKEFATDDELANHLLDHAEETTFKNELSKCDGKSESSNSHASPSKPFRVFPEFTRTSMVRNQAPRKNVTPRPISPEVWEIVSEDSDGEIGKSSSASSAPAKNSPIKLSTAKLISGKINGVRRYNHTNGAPYLNNLTRNAVAGTGATPRNALTGTGVTPRNSLMGTGVTPRNSLTGTGATPRNSLTGPGVTPRNAPSGTGVTPRNALADTGVQGFRCNTCSKVFTNLKALNEHVSVSHSKKDMFACQICYKTFSHKATLRQHLYLHVREKEHICSICDKGFSLKSQLRKHCNSQHATMIMPQNNVNKTPGQ